MIMAQMHKTLIVLCALTLILLGLFSLLPSREERFEVASLERQVNLFYKYSPPEVIRQVESQRVP
jgi:hypothetical protein